MRSVGVDEQKKTKRVPETSFFTCPSGSTQELIPTPGCLLCSQIRCYSTRERERGVESETMRGVRGTRKMGEKKNRLLPPSLPPSLYLPFEQRGGGRSRQGASPPTAATTQPRPASSAHPSAGRRTVAWTRGSGRSYSRSRSHRLRQRWRGGARASAAGLRRRWPAPRLSAAPDGGIVRAGRP